MDIDWQVEELEKLKVLVVDDTIVYRKILSAAVNDTGLAIAIQTASNGKLALQYLEKQAFDVVLLDVIMPEIDGLEVLDQIKKLYSDIVVIMISSGGSESAANTVAALRKGALDFILKPLDGNVEDNSAFLCNTLHELFLAIQVKKNGYIAATFEKNHEIKKSYKMIPKNVELIVIAVSTGGPEALDVVLTTLPADLKQPILIVQHMPKNFTKVLATMLDKKCNLQVVEAQDGDEVSMGKVFIAPGDQHMTVAKSGGRVLITLQSTPPVHGVRPAADVLFQSVASIGRGKHILVIILTGMGRDGKLGVMEMKQSCNCYCIAQSERTCTVYGMPQAVVKAGCSDEIADLPDISTRIEMLCRS